MKKYILLTIALLLTVLFQESFLLEMLGPRVNVNVVVSLIFVLILINKDQEALISAFTGGLILDLISVGIVGVSSLVLVLLVHVSLLIRRHLSKGITVHILLLMLGSVVYKMIAAFPSFEFSAGMLMGSALNVILSGLIYLLISSMSHRYKSDEFRIRA